MVKIKKNRWVKLLFNPGVIITLFLFFYLIFLIRGDLVKYFELISEKKFIQKSILAEENLKQAYLAELKQLDQSDYIEKLARLKLGLVKKGEVGYKIY
ncbi:MAG: septum formation initiator family protein [Candidatus Margulisbacteria bacterium]|nr:septum formation initiator family protein [Candidatus Margulisiibacteriota bacterium]MBU1021166.1 septum formation initiator family protein [Candidatus Margulisiibacteriota bacterium]MBU1729772.1 septum formation initiator family protein [Candidatus Margulisiibacteriota bacterium]MBU1955273.1 septum formation initiator family protein [Candidatus Margulisiibacteriota bacterium]